MRRVPAWITADGRTHTSQSAAEHHAGNRFGALLTSLAHEMVRVHKYHDATDWIERNLPRFLELEALRLDCIIENDFEEIDQ